MTDTRGTPPDERREGMNWMWMFVILAIVVCVGLFSYTWYQGGSSRGSNNNSATTQQNSGAPSPSPGTPASPVPAQNAR